MKRRLAVLILTASAAPAAAEEVRRPLSVSATVVNGCSVSSGTQTSVACTRGTSWARETGQSAARATSGPAPGPRPGTATRYLTVTY